MRAQTTLVGACAALLLANAVALAWLQQRGPLPAKVDAPAERAHQRCPGAGLFPSLRAATAVAARIERRGGATRVLRATLAGRPDHLVYLGPHVSRGTARRALRELEGRSIDGHIIGAGELANAIALGVYASAEAAEARRALVASAGYEASVKPIPRHLEGYAVMAAAPSPGAVDAAPPCAGVAPPPVSR